MIVHILFTDGLVLFELMSMPLQTTGGTQKEDANQVRPQSFSSSLEILKVYFKVALGNDCASFESGFRIKKD
jgi:hypothetical protein